jgi:hypothetical protein
LWIFFAFVGRLCFAFPSVTHPAGIEAEIGQNGGIGVTNYIAIG